MRFDLEERTFNFTVECRNLVRSISHKDVAIFEYSKQLIRSSGSVAANYIEANESISKKDFLLRIKICRKEAKESKLWLKLLDTSDFIKRDKLIQESQELINIFSTIIKKSQ